jgi:hypothetical protein
MKHIHNGMKQMLPLTIVIVLTVSICGCQTTVKQYATPDDKLFEKSKSKSGVSAYAQPILKTDDVKTYFGVDMHEKGILPVYIAIKNNTPKDSFIVQAETVKLKSKGDMNSINSPTSGVQDTGTGMGMAAVAVSPVMLPLSFVFGITGAVVELDGMIVDANYEKQRFRSKTIDSGQLVSGFLYYNWNELSKIDKGTICYELLEPLSDNSYVDCLDINIKGAAQ